MKRIAQILLMLVILTACSSPITSAGRTEISPTSAAAEPVPGPTLTSQPAGLPEVPYDLVSQESLLGYVEGLTSIQPYSGWRNSASSGEADALDYVDRLLHGSAGLKIPGMQVERQEFRVYMGTEIWKTGLTLTVSGRKFDVPANGLRGSRSHRGLTSYMDSDGVPNDSDPDPITSQGAPLLVRDRELIYSLGPEDVTGRILFLDYALIDLSINGSSQDNGSRIVSLVDQGLAGVVLITHYSNQDGESRGTLVGDGGYFQFEVPSRRVPILYARLEDLAPAGISSWEDLERIQSAQLLLDSDVFSPAMAGNLIAHIPGKDASRAVILGSHIDSGNTPGAFDNGAAAAALMEIARVLDASRVQPPVDLYLCWFGAHELGGYGASYFVATHQELLDRTLLMVQMDGLGLPIEGSSPEITLMATSYGRWGDDRLPAADFLSQASASQGIKTVQMVEYLPMADNSEFDAFNVPNLYLAYRDLNQWKTRSNLYNHYNVHAHDPYETVEHVREVADQLVDMTRVMLAAAFETGRLQPNLRVTPEVDRRALFIASHTEAGSIPPAMLREFGMALAWEGFEVDSIPYGQAVSAEDLQGVSLVVMLPTVDYPGPHRERWSAPELQLLDRFAADGGFMLVVNSSCNYAMKQCVDDENEDARGLNALVEPMGIRFTYGSHPTGEIARAIVEHPLTKDARYLDFYSGQGSPFRLKVPGLELIRATDGLLAALVPYGERGGEVLAIADLGLVQVDSPASKNLEFLKNIARYAAARAGAEQ